jgi:hypothetical protein
MAIRPIFIVGAPRSGTTLLQRMIRSHPNICSPTGESHFIIPLYKKRNQYTNLHTPQGIKNILEEMRRISREFVEEDLHGLTFDTDILSHEFYQAGITEIKDIITALFEKNMRGEGKSRWAEKTPYYILHMKTILEIYPDAQFIHIIRDGRDVFLSMMERKHDLKIYNIHQAAYLWKKYVDTGQETGKNLPKDTYFELRYEDLIENPHDKLEELCNFLNEPFSQSMVDFQKSKDPNSKTPLLKKPIQKSNYGKWKLKMKFWQIYLFESIAGDTLSRNNYPLLTKPKKIPYLLDKLFSAHTRFSIWYNRCT